MYDDIAAPPARVRCQAACSCWPSAQCQRGHWQVPRERAARRAKPSTCASAGQLGRGGSDAHQRAGADDGDEDAERDRPDLSRFANVKHFCSWLGLVSGHQDQRRQGAVGTHQALGQPGTPSAEDGSHEPLRTATRRWARSTEGCAPAWTSPGQHRHRPQARADGVLHADPRRGLRRSGQQRYEEQQRQRSIAALKRRAAALGFQINPVETAA
jgi:transposase